jgi:hypothetical protein
VSGAERRWLHRQELSPVQRVVAVEIGLGEAQRNSLRRLRDASAGK